MHASQIGLTVSSVRNEDASKDATVGVSAVSVFLLGAILALAAALDLFRLGAKSLWQDESTSVALAHLTWIALGKVVWYAEANMALYYGLLHAWVGMLGDSEPAIRSLSAILAVGAVGAVYVLGARMFDRRTGLVGALLLAVNAYQIAYGQEARGYSLVLLLVTLSSLAFLRTLERPGRTNVILYTVTSVLAVYAHFFAALVLTAQLLSVALLKPQRGALTALVRGAAIICLLLIPLVVLAVRNASQIYWISKPDARDVLNLFYALTGAGPTGAKPLLVAYVLACAGAVIGGVKQLAVAPFSFGAWRYWFLVMWFFVPIVLAIAVSIIKPVFLPYYLIVVLPALVLLAAAGISKIPVKAGAAAALVLMAAVAVYEDARYFSAPSRENWRAATAYAASHLEPGDGFLFDPAWLETPYSYYRIRVFPAGEPPATAFPWHWSWPRIADGEPKEGRAPDQVLRSLPSRYPRIWLFSRGGQAPQVAAFLRGTYAPEIEKSFDGVTVVLYRRISATTGRATGHHRNMASTYPNEGRKRVRERMTRGTGT